MASETELTRIAELEHRVQQLEAALAAGAPPVSERVNRTGPSPTHSRRGVLRLVGAGLTGAAGAMLARGVPAAAADGQSVVLGATGDAQNHMTSSTTIHADAGTYGGPAAVVIDSTAVEGVAALDLKAGPSANGTLRTIGADATATVRASRGLLSRGGSGSPPYNYGLEGLAASGGAAHTTSGYGGAGVVATGGDAGGDGGNPPGMGVFGSGGQASVAGGFGGAGVWAFGGQAATSGQGGVGLWARGGSGSTPGPALLLDNYNVPFQGPPTTGQHFVGEVFIDNAGVVYLCVSAGAPGVFAPLQLGGLNRFLYKTVINTQPSLSNSDGTTWMNIDATNLRLTITPAVGCFAILLASADLWTSTAGYNQDLGIAISGGAYPTQAEQPESWKEAGGNGTFAPTAAFVFTVVPVAAGTAYTVTLQWKSNKPTPIGQSSKIWAGAGPTGAHFSPTSLVAYLIPA